MGKVTELDKEHMLTIRYYGSVRYILFPVYLTATAAIVGQLYKSDNTIPDSYLAWAGLGLAIIFSIFEASLSWNLHVLWKEAKSLRSAVLPRGNLMGHRKRWLLVVQTLALLAPYVGGLLAWACVTYATTFEKDHISRIDAQKSVWRVIEALPAISGLPESAWEIERLNWDDAKHTLEIDARRKGASSPTYHVTFDSGTRRILTSNKVVESSRPDVRIVSVEELQRRLASSGYIPGKIDGLLGPVTKAAISAFQRAVGIPATGNPDNETLIALFDKRNG